VAGESVEKLAAAVLAGDGAAALRAVDALATEGEDLAQASQQLVEYFRDLMVLAVAPGDADLVDVGGEERERLDATAANHSPATLLNILNVFLEASGPMTKVLSPRLVLEYAALKAARIRNLLPLEDLLDATADVEARADKAVGGEGAVEEEAPPAERATSLTETWQRVLADLRGQDRALHALVAPARLVSLTGDELTLGFPESHRVSAQKVAEETRSAAFAERVAAILGRQVKVRVEVEEGTAAPPEAEDTLFGDIPLVAEIQERYGGEIIEEKELTAPDEDES
jgi:DNA polymerase III gamma/tau subunit